MLTRTLEMLSRCDISELKDFVIDRAIKSREHEDRIENAKMNEKAQIFQQCKGGSSILYWVGEILQGKNHPNYSHLSFPNTR